jgi:hypothetical protein
VSNYSERVGTTKARLHNMSGSTALTATDCLRTPLEAISARELELPSIGLRRQISEHERGLRC